MTEAAADPATDPVLAAVKQTWGYDTLRPLQAEAIDAGVEGRDAVVVLPTGGGKSLCYQVPPLVTGKATLVVSPLIALMRDQVRGLELSGVPAAALHSGVEWADANEIESRLISGGLNIVLAAPERMVTTGFKTLVARLADSGRLGNIAVDEAHCISSWGHDFRPEYRRLAELRQVAPGVPMQAFTATATPRVREDIAAQLGLTDPEFCVGDFDRPNLTYRVRARRDAAEQTADAVRRMRDREGPGGGAIVYCISRKDTEQLADALNAQLKPAGITAAAYHAGLNARDREDVETRFANENIDVVCATVAFGMGVDRSNVRLVVHAASPKSVEAYQQETGRAGRDGLPAECLLLDGPADGARWERLFERSLEEHGDHDTHAAQLQLLRDFRAMASACNCRHRALVEYFGQTYTSNSDADTSTGCGACDVCLGETVPEPDPVRIGQIIMSAVARVDERHAAGHVSDVVRGANTEKVRTWGHDQLSVYGLLSKHRKSEIDWFIDTLVAHGALARGEFQALRFGPRGRAVMKGDDAIPFSRPMGLATAKKERSRSRASQVDIKPLAHDEKELFESLRQLRKSIAEDRGVPPYVVFPDTVLRDLARTKPATRQAMLAVKGIGPAKLAEFGDDFLKAIEEHGDAHADAHTAGE